MRELILPRDAERQRLISDHYRELQAELHNNPNYGVASVHYAPIVSKVCNQYGVQELLDYGAGKANLMKHLTVEHSMKIQLYDPAVPKWSDRPEPSEMVACIDVLEHIEPQKLDNVLDDLKRCVKRIGLFTVSTVEAKKFLPDGRNAHLIVEPSSWWLPKILERWDLHVFQKSADGFLVLVMPYEVTTLH
jgi:hypothetical protein